MKKFAFAFAVIATLAACGGTSAPTTTAPGLQADSKVSVLFQDFPSGTVCTVSMPGGALQTAAMPGKIDYPAANRTAPVNCTAPDGARYRVDVPSVLPQGAFRVAGITASAKGWIVSTVSAGELIRLENADGVQRIK